MTDKTDEDRWTRIETLFDAALQLPAEQRDAFLRSECADDSAMLSELRSLLAADEKPTIGVERFVGRAAANSTPDPVLEKRFGNYEAIELIGSGGTSNVYLGRRVDRQFTHEVAIKVLQRGNVNRQFIERFRAERQVLANLDHPNIAKLLDGGETEDGLQYFVMEYVRGEAINDYCDRHQLDIHDRLRLFQDCCLAVDYAHRNLVIHRDVKPSNILVSEDGIPKLLDFGIAKVLDESGLQALTMASQRMMTPEYASPEQVRGEPVSVATDVYSLGVLLYRLLCGRSPYSVRSDLPSGLMRAILEELPSKPSTVLSTAEAEDNANELAQEANERRESSVTRWRNRLRGDLDNIALMALRKEPDRRYASASAIYEDIELYLSDRPIRARAETLSYVTGKFLRRNGIASAVTAAFFLALSIAVFQVVKQRDRAEAQAATATRVSDYLVSVLESSNPYEHSNNVTARQLLDQGAKQIDAELLGEPLVSARLRTTMARAYSSLGLQDTAAELGQNALQELSNLSTANLERADAFLALAEIEYERQDYAAAQQLATSALQLFEQHRPGSGTNIAMTKVLMSKIHLQRDQPDLMMEIAKQAVNELTRDLGLDDPQSNAAIANLSAMHNEVGNYAQAQELAEQVVAWTEATYGDDDISVAAPLHHLGKIHWNKGDFRTANSIYERELKILESTLGERHPSLNNVLTSLAVNQRKIGYEENAKAYYERAIAVLEESESPALGQLANNYGSLGTLLMDEGFLDKAEPLIRRAVELNEKIYGAGNAENAFRLLHLGVLHRKREQYGPARDYIQQAIDVSLNRYGETHRTVQIMRLHLGVTESQAGNVDKGNEILVGVLASLRANQGIDHPLVGQTLLELSANDIERQEYELADQRLILSLEIYRKHRDEWHPDVELLIRLRAQAREKLGDNEMAADLVAEADRLHDGRQRVTKDEADETQESKF